MIDFNKWWQRRERHLHKIVFEELDTDYDRMVAYVRRVARDAYNQGRVDEYNSYLECTRKEQP